MNSIYSKKVTTVHVSVLQNLIFTLLNCFFVCVGKEKKNGEQGWSWFKSLIDISGVHGQSKEP